MFSEKSEIKRSYVPNPKPSHRTPPSVLSLLNLKHRWHNNINEKTHEPEVDDQELLDILSMGKDLELKSKNSMKIDLGQAEMGRIIQQMKSLNGDIMGSTQEIKPKNCVAGIEIPRYCDYLQGKRF